MTTGTLVHPAGTALRPRRAPAADAHRAQVETSGEMESTDAHGTAQTAGTATAATPGAAHSVLTTGPWTTRARSTPARSRARLVGTVLPALPALVRVV